MTVRQLATALLKLIEHSSVADDTVVIRCANPSIGGAYKLEIGGVHAGFDWDTGRTFIALADNAEVLHLPERTAAERCVFDDVTVEVVENGNHGVGCILKHDGGYITKKPRIPLTTGDRLRIIKLEPRKARPTPNEKAL